MGLQGAVILLTVTLTSLCLLPLEAQQLQIGFYSRSCPQAEFIVMDEVRKAEPGIAAGLLRMHFHDCFVRGCDGSVLIDSTPSNSAEKDSPVNNPSLRGFEVIDQAKARIEAACPGVVSCADILAFSARDSVAKTGGQIYRVPAGRRDGRVSILSETFSNLPAPTLNVTQLVQAFQAKGLSKSDMVTLSGAHTLGRSHCSSFSNRLYNFSTTMTTDPTLDTTFTTQLKQQCPQGSTDAGLVVPMDPRSPYGFDSSYYINILTKRGLFTSDQTLVSDPSTATLVLQNSNGSTFKDRFASAMVKMGSIGVLTGSKGEIRKNCRVIN